MFVPGCMKIRLVTIAGNILKNQIEVFEESFIYEKEKPAKNSTSFKDFEFLRKPKYFLFL